MKTETYICSTCKIEKPIIQFPKRLNRPRGHDYRCKACNRIKANIYEKAHPEKRRARKNAAYRREKLKAFVAYGNRCMCCGETEEAFLNIDHVNNDGSAQRKEFGAGLDFYRWLRKNNYPNSCQLLCRNCNWGKYLYGICPHKKHIQVCTQSVVHSGEALIQ